MKKMMSLMLSIIMALVVNTTGLEKACAQKKESVKELVESLEVGEPVYYENLTIIPIYISRVKDQTRYTTLEGALKNKWLGIAELEGGHVPQVKLTNRSNKYIYIMGGEILSGCKQDRIIGRDILLGPKSKNVLAPVYCVEQGRWAYQSNEFYSKANLGTHELRAEAQIARGASQTKIWDKVSQLNRRMKVNSKTDAYQEVYERNEVKEKMVSFKREFQNIPQLHNDTVGIVVGVGKEIVSVDIFANPYLFEKMWPKLLKSSTLSAIGSHEPGVITQRAAAKFLSGLHYKKYKQNSAIDLGIEFCAVDNEANINALVYRNIVIHLSAFPQEGKGTRGRKEKDTERRIPVMKRQR
ncbi:MAG: hypothetical protein KAS99_02945 [Candidatus Omnitrophica bacterium]|nr:hypothetical protein [Candidatus Omnitrophota bacterium]